MANYDRPAFIYPNISKDIMTDGYNGDFDVVPVSDAVQVAIWADMENAFLVEFGTGSGPQSYPIAG